MGEFEEREYRQSNIIQNRMNIDEFYEIFNQGFPDAIFNVRMIKGLDGRSCGILIDGFNGRD